jgi:hypothetical protein
MAREEWIRRFNAVLHIAPFASWHNARGNVDQRKCMSLETDRCSLGGGGGGSGASASSTASSRLPKRYLNLTYVMLCIASYTLHSCDTLDRISTPNETSSSLSSSTSTVGRGSERKSRAEDTSEAARIKGKYSRLRD